MMRRSLAAGVLLACVYAAGCGGGSESASHEKTVPVSGTVTYKGQPVADASVAFVPENPMDEKARGAFGRTDASGKYTLMTFEPGDGAVPGNYKVTITKVEGQTETAPETGADDYVDPEAAGQKPAQPKHLLPKKYSSAASTDLMANVPDGDAKEFNFELTD